MFRKIILSTVTTTVLATASISSFTSAATAGTRLTAIAKVTTMTASTNKVASANIDRVAAALSFVIDNGMKNRMQTMQWTMKAGSDGRPILSGNQYRLVNAVSKAGLTRQVRTFAANLGWLDQGSNAFNVRIKRQAGNGQVRYGDVVALEVQSYGWLRYKKQNRGINLSDDDNTPHYMWKVTGGTRGTKLVAGMPFALFNTNVRAEMTHCIRTTGIDLGWNGKSDCGSFLGTVSNAVFGPNGLFATDGLSGRAAVTLKNHICTSAIGVLAEGLDSGTLKLGNAIIDPAKTRAIEKCQNF